MQARKGKNMKQFGMRLTFVLGMVFALSVGFTQPQDTCTSPPAEVEMDMGGSVGANGEYKGIEGGVEGEAHTKVSFNPSQMLDALGDFICKIFPCGGTGGVDNGGDDEPKGDDPKGEPTDDPTDEPTDDPKGEPTDGSGGNEGAAGEGETAASSSDSHTCSTSELGFYEIMDLIEVNRSGFRNGNFVVEYSADNKVGIAQVTFGAPFRVPEFILRANGFEGNNAFIPAGTYKVENNRLVLPVKRRN